MDDFNIDKILKRVNDTKKIPTTVYIMLILANIQFKKLIKVGLFLGFCVFSVIVSASLAKTIVAGIESIVK